MKQIIILISVLFTSLVGMAQTDVTNYLPSTTTEGITYFLPKSIIEIEVTATHVKFTPGEFSKYAERYLRLTGISDREEEYWQLDKIKATSIGVPDPDKSYVIKLKDKTVAPFVELTEDGIIKSINAPLETKSSPAPQTTSSIVKRLNARDFMTEEILMASSSAKMAELIAKEIYNIRESKNAITRGQADNMPKDGESLKLMLKHLEEQEQAMMDMFTGITDKTTKTFTIRLIPNANITKEILFRFSRHLGVVSNNDLAGAPIYVMLTDMNTLPENDDKAKKEKKKPEGIVYNVPGKAEIKIFDTKKIFFEGELPITQFGVTETLPNNYFNKKNTTQVIFNPATGGISKIEVEDK